MATEWELEEKELYALEEVSPELAWNSGGVAIRGGRGKVGLTQKQLAGLTGICLAVGGNYRPLYDFPALQSKIYAKM